jgi:hypothetical protein
MNKRPPKVSAYLAAGAPTKCFLPSCRKPFNSAAIRGQDGHYYCSENCAHTIDLRHVEELRPKPMLSPKDKLFGRG